MVYQDKMPFDPGLNYKRKKSLFKMTEQELVKIQCFC